MTNAAKFRVGDRVKRIPLSDIPTFAVGIVGEVTSIEGKWFRVKWGFERLKEYRLRYLASELKHAEPTSV